jgi:hypothetical protein
MIIKKQAVRKTGAGSKALILASVVANLWGVVWIYKFDQTQYLGLHWVGF